MIGQKKNSTMILNFGVVYKKTVLIFNYWNFQDDPFYEKLILKYWILIGIKLDYSFQKGFFFLKTDL